MRGRPPKSIEQHKAEGTYNPTRHKHRATLPSGEGHKPSCPKHLKGEARKAYKTLVADLWEQGFIDAGDRLLIAAAAMQYALAMNAYQMVVRLGQVYPVTRGARYGASGYTVMEANAAARLQRMFLAEFRQSATLLGVGPGARARLEDTGCRKREQRRERPGSTASASRPRPSRLSSDTRRRPACSTWLSGNARTAWRMLMNDLWDSRVIDIDDRTALATAAMHYGAAMSALELIDRHGAIYPVTRGARDGASGYKVVEANPATRVLRDSLAEFRQCCDLLGIGPSARSRLRHLGMKNVDIRELLGLSMRPVRVTCDPVTGERKVDDA